MKRLSIITVSVALFSLSGQRTFAQNGYDLLQKGLVAERTRGDLDQAIRLYRQIIDNHAEDRVLVAKALLQMGGCYEKMGRTEAQKTYSRIIEEYADQPEQVAQARARLAAIRPQNDMQQTGLTTRELKIEYIRGLSLNRDGSKLLYTAMKSRRENAVLRDLITGEEVQITHYASGDERGMWPVFSPDGNQVAYMDVDCNLHIFSLQTGEVRNLNHQGGPMDWSSDGQFILLGSSPARGLVDFSVVSLDNSTAKKLDLQLPYGKRHCRFSPDSKYVSYSNKGNLYLYHIEKDNVIQITKASSENVQPIWCPDGKTILFLSRRSFGPEWDLCTIPIIDGQAAGDVQIVVPDIGNDIQLCSLSQEGQLLYEQSHVDKQICSITVDPETGEPLGAHTRMVAGSHPVWSSDGKQIAYFNDRALHVMSADGNNDQRINSVGFHLSGTYAWGPDNDTIYMPELRKGRIEISSISVSNRQRQIVWPGDDKTDAMHVTCSPDGKKLAFPKLIPATGKYQIFTMDIDGTNLLQLTFSEEHNAWYPARSPDGRQIAFMSRVGDFSTLVVVSVEDGAIREVFKGTTQKDRFYHKSWSPDGSKIVWGTQDSLRIGEIATGKYRALSMNAIRPLAPCWSPDGTRILFNTTEVSKVILMDNFLAKPDKVK